jgi:hypothetical protein
MAQSSDSKVTVRVEVIVDGVREKSEGHEPGPRVKPFQITSPTPGTDTPVRQAAGGINFISAKGQKLSPSNKPARVVWARVYPAPNQPQGQRPDCGAISFCPDPAGDGSWFFDAAHGNELPGATCDAVPAAMGGRDNNTLQVWYDYDDSTPYDRDATNFHGFCPGPGGGGSGSGSGLSGSTSGLSGSDSGLVRSTSRLLPATLLATFAGALAPLGSVPLLWNGAGWVGTIPQGGGAILSLLDFNPNFALLSVGPGVAFSVGGAPDSVAPFHWSAQGAALGPYPGPFTVTVTE